MAEKRNPKPEAVTTPDAGSPTASPQQAPSSQQRIEVDDSRVSASYANFCRVTGSPEELILDFGLNPQPVGTPTQPLPLTQRVILNYYTAKRLTAALQVSLQRHEGAFGVLETDIQKRVVPAQMRRAAESGA
jgi:hypothetical protein